MISTNQTFVLGNKVTKTADNSVFLGHQSGFVQADANPDGSLNEANAKTTAGTRALTKQVTAGVESQYAGGESGQIVGVVSVGDVAADGTQKTRRIQNVAPGLVSETSTDAINGSQLYAVANATNKGMGDVHNHLNAMNNQLKAMDNKLNRNNKNLRAGIAGTNAAAALPQVYLPGKSMVAAAAGTYQGQGALAIGYSRASDNGKLILKMQGNANTRGEFGAGVGVGYQW